MNLHEYDLVIINSSGGKDSLCSIWEVCRLAGEQQYPYNQIVISHQDLGEAEWPGTKEIVQKQSDFFGIKTVYSKRRNKNGKEETFLEYVKRRGMWPSSKMRWCTSDFKRGPGSRVVTNMTKNLGECRILYVFGFRAEESPSRAKKKRLSFNKRLSTKNRKVYDWHPILHWSLKRVWQTINRNKLPVHYVYGLKVPRHSCKFCFFSPFDALVIAGRNNYKSLREYVDVEEITGHSFKIDHSLKDVLIAIDNGYQPIKVKNWVM